MRLLLIITLFLSTALLINCKNKGTQSFKPQKEDTVKTVALFVLGNSGELRVDFAFKIKKDMQVPVLVDSSGGTVTTKSKWVRDSVYLVPIADTVRGTDKKPKLDSLGRSSMEVIWYPINKHFILNDFGVNMAEVSKYMIK
jgi:hypothetical protein